jgi:hypothetical protein
MRIMNRLAAIVAVGVGIAAGVAAQTALPQMGVSEASAQAEVLRSVGGGGVDYGMAAKAFKAVTGAARAQLATAAIAWTRAYTASPAFHKAYVAHRQGVKPQEPAHADTPEQALAKQKAEREQQVEEMKKSIAAMPPEQRKVMEEAVKSSAAAFAEMDTPEMRKMQLDGLRMQRDLEITDYKSRLESWEQSYPENPAPLIARRLQAFLDLSATVDFDAALESRDGMMRFVNPAYERKDGNWKLCYRAGRETVAAARSAAQAWLKELR